MRRFLVLAVLACVHASLQAASSDEAPAGGAEGSQALQPDKPVPAVKPFCSKISKLCIGRKPAQGAQAARTLDLQVTRDDLAWLLAQLKIPDEDETLEVRGRRVREHPDVPPGVFSVIWAVKNPTRAWRILAPVPAEESK